MKYESSILKRLIDTYGVIGNPRYLSEIIKEFIVRGKELYPQLFTYQSDWLAHIDEFGLTPEYTVSYTGQHIYAPNTKEKPVKSAILKGNTGYRDIDTGEILETFEEGRNLELVSVKVPVLTTIGKNLFNLQGREEYCYYNSINGLIIPHQSVDSYCVEVRQNTTYTITVEGRKSLFHITFWDKNLNFIIGESANGDMYQRTFTTPSKTCYVKFSYHRDGITSCQLEVGSTSTSYEPSYKSNILTVNGDVTLRSNGDVCDELDLLTGKLTQRIDEDGGVLVQEVVKTVDLTIHDKDHQKVERLTSFEGGTNFNTSSQDGSLLPTLTVDVVTDLEETLLVCSLEGNTM